jgi:hypothetical protein
MRWFKHHAIQTTFIIPYKRIFWKAVAKAQHVKAHANLRRAVAAERELDGVPGGYGQCADAYT